ncbi:MAG: S9 family peptidase [Anaerolineaceae bacterium]|nr:S9 family peptidase [Anaerolineaceae bacterium]
MSDTVEQRPLIKEDLFNLKFLQDVHLSPDEKYIVYGIYEADGEKEKSTTALWLYNLETDEQRQITTGKGNESSPAWSPDSKTIAFVSTRDEKPQIYLLPIDGGEALPLTKMEQGVRGNLVWSPDGQQITFTAGKHFEEPPDPSKPYRVTRNIYRFDSIGNIDLAVQNIFIISVDGDNLQQITKEEAINTDPFWSPSGKEILFKSSFKTDSFNFFGTFKIANLDGEIRTIINDDWGMIGNCAWSKNGKKVVFSGTPSGKDIGSKSDLFVLDLATGKTENRTTDLGNGIGGGLQGDTQITNRSAIDISEDGKFAFQTVQNGGTVNIYKIALSGPQSYDLILSGDRELNIRSIGNSKLIFTENKISRPADIYMTNLDGSNEKRLTKLNCMFLRTLEKPSWEHLLFPSIDGTEVEGWIIKPPNGKPPYPTILYIHGGPHSGFGHTYSFDFQMLASAGYAVLAINQRASTGYGDKFATAIKGDWGNLDYQDLMFGVDYCIEKGLTDPERMGVCGISGGGNLSCWIVGQTDRFKAAVPENPVVNWNTMYGVSDISVVFAELEMGGLPHEIPEVYAKCSPITYAHKCKTPTLLLQGEADFRCPAEQSEQFYTTLKANGCVVEMVRFPNSPHAGSIVGEIPVKKAQNDALLDWMNRYVLGISEEEKAA